MDSNYVCGGIWRVVGATRLVGDALGGCERRTPVRFVPRGLELGRWNVVECPVEPFGVEPVNPLQGGQLDLVDVAPRSPPADELGLVEPVERLCQRVVVALSGQSGSG